MRFEPNTKKKKKLVLGIWDFCQKYLSNNELMFIFKIYMIFMFIFEMYFHAYTTFITESLALPVVQLIPLSSCGIPY